MGLQSREKLENFRGYGGAQSYPSRTKDIDDVDFSTGSVGLGVAMTAFAFDDPGLSESQAMVQPGAAWPNDRLGR